MNKIIKFLFYTQSLLWAAILFSCDTEGNLEPQVSFIKYYGGEGNQEAVDLHVNSDGTIILLGTSISNGRSTIFLVKTDPDGNTLKTAMFGNGTDVARDLEATFDGNLIVLARTRVQNVDSIKLIKISPDLVKIDSVMDGFAGKDVYPNTITAVEQFGERDYIVTGSTNQVRPQSSALQAIMHLRYHENLVPYNQNWEELTDVGVNQVAVSITQVGVKTISLGDNRLYVMCYNNVPQDGGVLNNNLFSTPLFFNRDNEGVLNGGPTGGGTGDIIIVEPTNDTFASATISSTNAVATISTSIEGGIGKVVFSRFPIYTQTINLQEVVMELGNPIQTKLLLGGSAANANFEAVKIEAISTGGYYITANQIEIDLSRNIWVSKIDESGNVLWSSNFGAKENDDRAGGVAELSNGRVVVLGTMHLENQDKLALINLNRSGELKN